MNVLSCPKVISAFVVVILLVQLVEVESGKIERSKKYSNKENRCPEGKDGGSCTKSGRQGIAVEKPSSFNPTEVAIPNRRPNFAKRFEHAMNFAERMIVEFSRELFGFYGLDKDGWEIGVVELIVRTVAKDMLFIMQAMQH